MRPMDAKAARSFYEEYLDTIYHRRELGQLGRFFATDIVPHPPVPGAALGLEAVRAAIAGWLEGFTENRFALDGFVFDGHILAARLHITAHHTGPFFGMPATGRRIDIIGHPHYRLEHGKVAEYWDLPDTLTLLQQLGALPAPG